MEATVRVLYLRFGFLRLTGSYKKAVTCFSEEDFGPCYQAKSEKKRPIKDKGMWMSRRFWGRCLLRLGDEFHFYTIDMTAIAKRPRRFVSMKGILARVSKRNKDNWKPKIPVDIEEILVQH
jgi:hypothetical protein